MIIWTELKKNIVHKLGREMTESEELHYWWDYVRVMLLDLDPLPDRGASTNRMRKAKKLDFNS